MYTRSKVCCVIVFKRQSSFAAANYNFLLIQLQRKLQKCFPLFSHHIHKHMETILARLTRDANYFSSKLYFSLVALSGEF
jgi:hypothetical protein